MPRVLVLALDNWLGAARLPRALYSAGFEVSLLCYPDTLVALTKFAQQRDHCAPADKAEDVARRMIRLLEQPTRLIIPADDRALRFLQHIVEVTPLGVLPRILTDVAARSLPDPSAFRYGDDKEAAAQLMAEHGIPVPRKAHIDSLDDLRAFTDEVGLPVVLKPVTGTAGQGVQILRIPDDLATATITDDSAWIAQKYIVGRSAGSASVAVDGECLATVAFEKTLTHPGETGPASVVTKLDTPTIYRAAQVFAEATRFNGFYSPGFMVESGTGEAYFLEVNTRPVPMVPSAYCLGVDLCRSLYAKLVGAPLPAVDPDAPRQLALYPQELHRDPNSPYRDLLLDEPIDDPIVHQAMKRGIELLAAGKLTQS